jgi:hypothetical protein
MAWLVLCNYRQLYHHCLVFVLPPLFFIIRKWILRKMGRQNLYWIDLALDNDGWCDFVNAVMILRDP